MRGLSKPLARCLAVGVPVVGLVMALAPAAGASTLAHPSMAAARAELQTLLKGWRTLPDWVGGSRAATSRASGIEGLTKVESSNWSGYADTGSGFTKVSTTFTQPTGTCTSATSLAAFWVGIDGFSSDSVEQDGTLIECDGGTAFYFTWWEMYPSNDVQIVGESLSPGDSIAASVTRSGDSYKLTVTDSTDTANSFSTTQTCSDCDNSSAEWIAEAPSSETSIYPLTHFSEWHESNGDVSDTSKSGKIKNFTDDEITMVDSSGDVEAQPGPLNSVGGAFHVIWERST
jgi:hypothetical protein